MTHIYDIIIIGSGPAGLSAAIYAGRAGLKTLVVGSRSKSRAYGDYDFDNYMGLPGATGKELIDKGYEHAKKFNPEFLEEEVLKAIPEKPFKLQTSSGKELFGKTLIIATGMKPMAPQFPDQMKYKGKGVSECVSCDGYFFKDKKVIVVGEGNHAAVEALDLLSYTKNVKIYTNGKEVNMENSFLEKLKECNIEIKKNKIQALKGEPMVSAIVTDEGEEEVNGLFLGSGITSPMDLALNLGVALEGNFIKIDKECQTNVEGIFAAGDCRGGIMQIAQAVGDGATAALKAIRCLKCMK